VEQPASRAAASGVAASSLALPTGRHTSLLLKCNSHLYQQPNIHAATACTDAVLQLKNICELVGLQQLQTLDSQVQPPCMMETHQHTLYSQV
jgi:hypothetical protein